VEKPWYAQWFGKEYLDLYGHRDPLQAKIQVNELLTKINLAENAVVLDAGCGAGRHLKELKEQGLNAFGMDLSLELLSSAPQGLKEKAAMVRADLFRLPFKETCFEGVFSFFTSFGYFDSEEKDLELLKSMVSVLKSGGWLFLDLMNSEVVKAGLPFKDVKETLAGRAIQDRYFKDGVVCKDISLEKEGVVREYKERVRVYSLEKMQAYLLSYGMECIQVFGDEKLSVYEPQKSPRMSLLARKI
jgi:SAM-dependent methyltransferase